MARRAPGREAGATFDFVGAAVVVTGGARGVGASIARAFLSAGAEVMVCGRHEPSLDELPRSVVGGVERAAGFLLADVRQPDQVQRMIDAALARAGRLDVLVNNAGGSPQAAAAAAPAGLVASIVALNLLAPFYCSQAAYPALRESAGSIVNIGSVSGIRPSPGTAAYGAAKAGLVSLTGSLAVEWAPEVRVNCVTGGLLNAGGASDHYGGQEGLARVAATVPLGRVGVPDDIAAACLFLASPLASYVTGSNLVVHGGGEWPAFLRAAAQP